MYAKVSGIKTGEVADASNWDIQTVRFFALSLLLCIQGCTEQTIEKLQGSAQGTTYHISYWSESPVDYEVIKASIETEFQTIDKLLSNYRPDSVIETFNQAENTESFEVGTEIVALVRLASVVHQDSQGCYDLTIKPLFDLWGFHNERQAAPEEAAILKTLKQVDMGNLEVVDDTHLRKKRADLKVDLSSIAQGYSVGKMSQILTRYGVKNYLVEIGGELKTHGHKPDNKPWRIALERPLPGEQALHKIVTMPKDLPYSLMTSGTYRHFFDENGVRYSHILDARTGRAVSHDLVSVTVIHQDPAIADAWSTALLCLGQQEGVKVANSKHIAAFFIQQQGNELIESRSDPLSALAILTIH
ncbi:MAG: FAD:protein FMN transferase [Methylococcaceae bacterium]|nr:FAD:protein FMN transferase [Methylococcaceae bacterium]